jgi:hypothetical protein
MENLKKLLVVVLAIVVVGVAAWFGWTKLFGGGASQEQPSYTTPAVVSPDPTPSNPSVVEPVDPEPDTPSQTDSPIPPVTGQDNPILAKFTNLKEDVDVTATMMDYGLEKTTVTDWVYDADGKRYGDAGGWLMDDTVLRVGVQYNNAATEIVCVWVSVDEQLVKITLDPTLPEAYRFYKAQWRASDSRVFTLGMVECKYFAAVLYNFVNGYDLCAGIPGASIIS